MSTRDKARLRKHGWAGECTREEAEYIRDWLRRKYPRICAYITLEAARIYARGE